MNTTVLAIAFTFPSVARSAFLGADLAIRVFGWALSSPGFDDDFSNSRLIATISWWFSPKISAIEAHRDLTTLSSVSFLNDTSRDKAADPTYDAKWSGVDDPYETVGLNSPRPLSAEGS